MATVEQNRDLKKLDPNSVRLLWLAGFWDGPINGLCLYDDKKCWFELMLDSEHDPFDCPRRFLVFEIPPENLAEEERWHELFRQKVGTHCDYGDADPTIRPTEMHREFYEPYQQRVKPNYLTNRAIGWFERS